MVQAPSVIPHGYCSTAKNTAFNFQDVIYPSKAQAIANLAGVFDEATTLADIKADDIFQEAKQEGEHYGKSLTDMKIWSEALMPANEASSLIYDYSSLLYNNIVLPKKMFVSEGGQYQQEGLLHERNLTYRVDGEFAIVTNPPSWRNFFAPPPKKVYEVKTQSLETALLHKGEWKSGFLAGYKEGVCLSYLDMLTGLKRLSSDYTARYQYVIADHAGITKPPNVKFVNQDLIEEENAITLGGRIYKVKDTGAFDDKKNWGIRVGE